MRHGDLLLRWLSIMPRTGTEPTDRKAAADGLDDERKAADLLRPEAEPVHRAQFRAAASNDLDHSRSDKYRND
jgi:hypothetical protein